MTIRKQAHLLIIGVEAYLMERENILALQARELISETEHYLEAVSS